MLNKIATKKKKSEKSNERSKDRSADSKLDQSVSKHLQDQAVEIIKSTLVKMSSSSVPPTVEDYKICTPEDYDYYDDDDYYDSDTVELLGQLNHRHEDQEQLKRVELSPKTRQRDVLATLVLGMAVGA